MKQLRDYQANSINLVRGSLASGKKHPMLQLSTGAGKTLIAANIVKSARAKNKRVIFVVPALSLINQTVEAFRQEGLTEVGVIQADHPLTNYSKPIQIASIQTVSRRKHIPDADLVIVDEAHVQFKSLYTWMERWNAIPFVGLSATPWSKGLGKHYDDLLIGATTKDLIDRGYLSDFKVFAPSTPDLSKVRTLAGDYHEGDLSAVMGDSSVIGSVVGNWLEKGLNLPTLCFGVDRAHAKALALEFQQNGVETAYIDAYTDITERDEISQRFRSGEVKVICNVGTMTTGVDLDVRCLILARPTKSESLFVQIIGRCLRTAEGKDYALIFDHTGSHTRLGFVTDIGKTSLCHGEPNKDSASERDEPLPKECSQCHFLKPAKVHECPACGHKPEKQSGVQHESGHLVELKAKDTAAVARNRRWNINQKTYWYHQLVSYGACHGYKDGWAKNKYRDYFSVWPNKIARGMADPTPEFLSWVKHSQIKYSKGRAA